MENQKQGVNNKMKDEILEFECHCRIWKFELKYKKCRKHPDGSRRKAGYYCPEHDRPVKYRISYCSVCKIEILNEYSSGGQKVKCDKHIAESIKKCTKIQNKKKSVKLKRKKKRQEKQKLAKIEKSKMKKNTSKDPVRVWSIPEAKKKSVACIPARNLFARKYLDTFC